MKTNFFHYVQLIGISMVMTTIIAIALYGIGLIKNWISTDQYIVAFSIASILCFISAWAIFTGAKRRAGHELPYRVLTSNPTEGQGTKEVITTGITFFAEKPKHSLVNIKIDQFTADINQGYDVSFVLLISGILLGVLSKIITEG